VWERWGGEAPLYFPRSWRKGETEQREGKGEKKNLACVSFSLLRKGTTCRGKNRIELLRVQTRKEEGKGEKKRKKRKSETADNPLSNIPIKKEIGEAKRGKNGTPAPPQGGEHHVPGGKRLERERKGKEKKRGKKCSSPLFLPHQRRR